MTSVELAKYRRMLRAEIEAGSCFAGMRLRGVLIHEVFRKVLYLTPSERAKFSSGRIYSHVTSDVETIQQLSWSGLGIISSPLRIIGTAAPG
jgi:ABC-type multidrug transport system fused ATPase/permease subunit